MAAYLLINYLQIGKFIATRDNIDAYALSPILESRNIYPKNITAPEENKEKPEISSLVERRSQIEITSARFNQEIRDLGRRGNVNLVIGIVTTLAGVTALVYVVFGESEINSIDFSRYAIHFVLRLSIALFIEVFAYFFLRLYKSNLDDIKYYQNEITNIELKLTALDTALKLSNTAASKTAIEEILKTERNFILKRGETTYLLEREKMEKNDILDIVKEAINTIRKIK